MAKKSTKIKTSISEPVLSDNKKSVNILGIEYKVKAHDNLGKNVQCSVRCESKEIFLLTAHLFPTKIEDRLYSIRVLHHEVIHAFCYECGANNSFCHNELLVDWLSVMLSKIAKPAHELELKIVDLKENNCIVDVLGTPFTFRRVSENKTTDCLTFGFWDKIIDINPGFYSKGVTDYFRKELLVCALFQVFVFESGFEEIFSDKNIRLWISCVFWKLLKTITDAEVVLNEINY